MRQLIVILILCSLTFGCAAIPMKKTTLRTGRTAKNLLVIVGPNPMPSNEDPSQYRIILHVKMWTDHPIYYRFSTSYCIVRGENFECVAPVEDANLEFELETVWPNNSSSLCDTLKVGISTQLYGLNGGSARADRWMDLDITQGEDSCPYDVPYDFVVGNRR